MSGKSRLARGEGQVGLIQSWGLAPSRRRDGKSLRHLDGGFSAFVAETKQDARVRRGDRRDL
ncbi:MAG TPA: hypothetical protein VLV54_07930, partial [Thermoanaerobaculia bacterium]|nr:hypothetical protein [Thermoanaerobaculia bacterium]